jgi:hypothetical protein
MRHLREELGVEVQRTPKRLPYVPTEQEIRRFYAAVLDCARPFDRNPSLNRHHPHRSSALR